MNQFYHLPKSIQWAVAITLIVILLFLFCSWLYLITNNFLWYILVFAYTPLFQFTATPLMRLLGVYQYLSPMLLVYSASDEKYGLHNGTSFDYLMIMTSKPSGIKLRNKILEYYLEGLLEIVRRVEFNELPETVMVRGSSYFFSENTAKRLGFEKEEVTSTDKLNMIINYLDLVWMYSVSKGKLAFPNLKNTKAVFISGGDLMKRKEQLTRLHQYMRLRNGNG